METGGGEGGHSSITSPLGMVFFKGVVRQEKRGVKKCINGAVSTLNTIANVFQVNLKGHRS
jgi:hypothetical protein